MNNGIGGQPNSHAGPVPDGTESGARLRAERHRSARHTNYLSTGDALGGTQYWGASVELQMPFWFLPKEVGLKGAIYADAGSLSGYKGPTSWALTGEVNAPGCMPATSSSIREPVPVFSMTMATWSVPRSVSA